MKASSGMSIYVALPIMVATGECQLQGILGIVSVVVVVVIII